MKKIYSFLIAVLTSSAVFSQIIVMDTISIETFGTNGFYNGVTATYPDYTSGATFSGVGILFQGGAPTPPAGSSAATAAKLGAAENDTLIMSGINTTAHDSVFVILNAMSYDGVPSSNINVQYGTDGLTWTEMDESILRNPLVVASNWGSFDLGEQLPITSNLYLMFINQSATQQIHLDDIIVYGYTSLPDTNAYLAGLSVATSILVPTFSATTMNYTVELPYGSISAPAITFTPASLTLSDTVITNVVDVTSVTAADRTYTIALTSENLLNTKTYTIEFNVAAAVSATGVSLDQVTLALAPAGSATLTETVAPVNATDKSVSWSTSDVGVATVTAGVVTAVADGTCNITVTTTDGSFTDVCAVTVTTPTVAVTGVTLVSTLTIEIGATDTLVPVIAPANATDKSFSVWMTTNAGVATISSGVVTGISVGTADIIVWTTDGNFSDTCSVTVITAASITNDMAADVKIYPIPTKSVLTISNVANFNKIEIIDMTGRVILSTNNNADAVKEINVESLNTGIYVLNLINGNESYRKTIIIE